MDGVQIPFKCNKVSTYDVTDINKWERLEIKDSLDYQWDNVSGGAEYEPDDSLTKEKNVKIKHYEFKELQPTSHLFPEEAGQTKRSTVATTHDEQTGENEQK